jgi:hypothetical protein
MTDTSAITRWPEPLVFDSEEAFLGGASGTAWFSQDRAYRYLLTRTWSDTPDAMTWIMLNPSTADAFTTDPTITRCVRFARREGCGSIRVVNLFALRATDPRSLSLPGRDPVGPSNDRFLDDHAQAHLVVAAWGAGGTLNGRAREVGQRLAAAGVPLKCLGVTAAGHPRHPLYVRSDAPLIPWEPQP